MLKKTMILIITIGFMTIINSMDEGMRYEWTKEKTPKLCLVVSPEKELKYLINIEAKKDLNGLKDLPGGIPEEIIQYIECLKNRNTNQIYNLLLYGETGTGKSLIPEIIAKETDRQLYKVSSSELITVLKGSGAKNIRKIFNDIRSKKQPSVLFIDDIDGIANKHFNCKESSNATLELCNQININDNLIIIIVATHRYDDLPSYFKNEFIENTIELTLPNKLKRLEILKFYAPDHLKSNLNFWEYLADQTEGFSYRTLGWVSGEAKLIASSSFKNVDLSVISTISEPNSPSLSQDKNKRVNEDHYLIAIHMLEQENLPDYDARKLLFQYYAGKKIRPFLNQNLTNFVAEEMDGFSADQIEQTISNLKEYIELEDPSELDVAILLTSIYGGQNAHLPKQNSRKEIFKFLLRNYTNFLDDIAFDNLAYYTENFNGKEIADLVSRAIYLIEDVEEKKFKLVEQKLYTVLHAMLIKKAIPTSVLIYCDNNNQSQVIQEIALSQESEYRTTFSTGTLGKTYSILDKKNPKKPNKRIRFFLLAHLLSHNRNLSNTEISFLAFTTKKLSWYMLEQLIKIAKEHSSFKQITFFEAFEKIALKFDVNYARKKQKFNKLISNTFETLASEDSDALTQFNKRKKFWKENKAQKNNSCCTIS